MSKEDPTGLASCPPGAYCVNVPPPKPSEPGNPGADITNGAPQAGNRLVAAELRAAAQGRNSPPARSLAERGFMAATGASVAADGTVTLTFGSTAEGIAVTGAMANPVGVAVATIVFILKPTSTSANDTTQGCGGPCDAQAPGATPPNLAPPNADRDAALAAAKAAAGIVDDHAPEVLPNYGKNPGLDSKPIPDSEILRYLDKDLNVQDIGHDYGGHQYPDDPSQNRGPHFNYPLGGGHYDYDSPGIPFNSGYFPKGSQ